MKIPPTPEHIFADDATLRSMMELAYKHRKDKGVVEILTTDPAHEVVENIIEYIKEIPEDTLDLEEAQELALNYFTLGVVGLAKLATEMYTKVELERVKEGMETIN